MERYRRNNPLNIRYSVRNHWYGQKGQSNGFCVFREERYGWRAGFILLKNYNSMGYNSVRKIVERWAPYRENPTSEYIRFVSLRMQSLGYESFSVPFEESALDLRNDEVVIDLLMCMSVFESGKHTQAKHIRAMLSPWLDVYNGDDNIIVSKNS